MNLNKKQLQANPEEKNNKINVLLQQFNKIDSHKLGSIKLSEAIKLTKIHINTNYKQKIDNFNQQILNLIILNNENQVTFDEFLAILYETQRDLEIHNNLSNQNMIDFLHLLQDYRKKCEQSSDYLEAEKAHQKILQIKSKQMKRHKQKLLLQQRTKVSSVNSLQQSKILQFNTAWNQYMQKYEQAAINSIEKLKAKHLREMQQEEERIRSYYENYLKPSKKLIDLRSKQKSLVKQKQYQQADRVKQYANKLLLKQRDIKQDEINQRIKKRKQTLQKHQQIALLALLKRIEKDRNEQMKQRQIDSQKMLFKLRNLQNDMVQKQSIEIKETLVSLRETMCLTSGQLFGKSRIKSLEKLDKPKQQVLNQTTNNNKIMQMKGNSKEKTSFKIRINSFHRVKLDHSMYDP